MKRKPKRSQKTRRVKASSRKVKDALNLLSALDQHKISIDELWAHIQKSDERMQDMEIHVNLLTRLLTTLCIEKFGMRVGVLKRMIKRIEKEAIRDSQISHLESLYKLPQRPDGHKGRSSRPTPKSDPWEDIS